jgi:predicted chitinase
MITILNKNSITDLDQIAQVLSYINIESNFLTFVEEDINWFNYYQITTTLGGVGTETYTPDTTPYRRRGLVKIQGEEQYREVGQILGKDLVGNPTTVSSNNQTHVSASETDEQVENSISVSIWYFKNKTSGNINTFENRSKIPKEKYTSEYERLKIILGLV